MCHHAQQLRTRSRFRCDATVCTGPLPRKVQMTRFFTVCSQYQFDIPGERCFAERLESCWKTTTSAGATSRSGAKARYPYFVVLHPRHTTSGLKTVANPMLQAHTYFKRSRHGVQERSAAGRRKNKSVPFFFYLRQVKEICQFYFPRCAFHSYQ